MAVAARSSSASKLLDQFGLCEEEYKKKVTDRHLLAISRSYFEKWKSLYPYLDMEQIDVTNAEQDGNGEENERQKFLERWKKKKGGDATYMKLISALLEVECKNDAEGVCELLLCEKASPPDLKTRIVPEPSPPVPENQLLVQPGMSLASTVSCTPSPLKNR